MEKHDHGPHHELFNRTIDKSREAFIWYPKAVRIAITARTLLLGGRGTSALNQDVWGVIFSYLAPGEEGYTKIKPEVYLDVKKSTVCGKRQKTDSEADSQSVQEKKVRI